MTRLSRSVKSLVVAGTLAATSIAVVATAPTASATGATVTTVSSNVNPSTVGQAVTFRVFVQSATIPGPTISIVPIFDGLDPIPIGTTTVTLDFGGICGCLPTDHASGTFTTSGLSKGTHQISATFLGDPSGSLPSAGTMTQTVNARATTTTVTSAPNPSVFGQGVTLSAQVGTNPASSHIPGGTVQFKVDGSNVNTAVPVDGSGAASTSVTGLNVGGHTVTADYTSTDAETLDSSGTLPGGQTVIKASTTTLVTTSGSPSVYGQSVTLTATPSVVAPGGGTPTGTVTFTAGVVTLGPVSLVGGQATVSTSSLSVGPHTFTATYSGDGNLFGSSGTVDQQVDKAPTVTTVTSSVSPAVYGQPVSFSALVCPAPPSANPVLAPTGSVVFHLDGSAAAFDTVTLGASSTPGCSTATSVTTNTLSVGFHSVTATYSSDGNYTASTSAAFSQEITKAPTVTTLTAVPASTTVDHAVVLTATVSPALFAGPLPPTGTVSFYVDGSLVPNTTVPLVGTTATYTTTFGGGTHSVVAAYNGDGNYLSSVSAPPTTVSVFCTTTITGTHSSLNVTSGTTCVSNARITGGISVAKGAVLDIENSTVLGSISANTPDRLRVCGSWTGSVSVSASTGFVLIGDPGVGNCAANTVSGTIVAANNKAGLVIVGNTVSGNVTAVGNSGAGPLPGQTGPIVSGNHH